MHDDASMATFFVCFNYSTRFRTTISKNSTKEARLPRNDTIQIKKIHILYYEQKQEL